MKRFFGPFAAVLLMTLGHAKAADLSVNQEAPPGEDGAQKLSSRASAEPAMDGCLLDSSTTTVEGCVIDRLHLFSPSMGRDIKVAGLLPPGYAEHPDKHYAVLYALDGMDAPVTAYSGMAPIRQALRDKPMIVVSFGADRDLYYIDSAKPVTNYIPGTKVDKNGNLMDAGIKPVESLFTTFFFDELIPAVDRRYRIDPHQRMLTGFSIGGFGAMHYLLTRPDKFASLSAMSGHFSSPQLPSWPRFTKWQELILPPSPPTPDHFAILDLYTRIEHLLKSGKKLPPVFLCCGTEDGALAESRAMHGFLQDRGVPCEYHESPGGHNFNFLERYVRRRDGFSLAHAATGIHREMRT